MQPVSYNQHPAKVFSLHRGLVFVVLGLLAGCSPPTTLEEIRQEKVLHVVTRNAPSVYYQGRQGPEGFEYELARRFADHLGVELRIQVADDLGEIFDLLDKGYTHFAAAGLAVNDARRARYRVSPVYMEATPVVISRRGDPRPDSVAEIGGRTLLVIANSVHQRYLEELAQSHPELRWQAVSNMGSVDLLKAVNEGEAPLAIVDSNTLAMNQVFFPKVRRAFELDRSVRFAWLFPASQDPSLIREANRFFQQVRRNGTLAQLRERYYGHLDRLNYVGAKTFIYHLRHRLPRYEATFKEAARRYDLDWRLLAAIGYQESHWRPNAVSPTGVRGLMMLTRATARHIGIENRLDPESSIMGGAEYFRLIYDRLPERLEDPDRLWFALASYNVGPGHLEDARILAERDGKDPDKWMHVKEYLPLLAQKRWYTQTRHGYARGHEPVIYVQNIRRYYDVLRWMLEPDTPDALLAEQQAQETPDTRPPENREAPSLAELQGGRLIHMTPPAL